MGRYRVLTPKEIGEETAEMLSSLNARLVKGGISKGIAEELVKRVAGAACSNGDGQCAALARIPGINY